MRLHCPITIDHNETWIMDAGLPGPDTGKGGKHVVLPPDHQSPLPDGVYSGRSSTNKALVYVRALPAGDDLTGALESLRQVKVYALASADAPDPLRVVDLTDQPIDITARRWEDNLDYWRKLHEVIDSEQVVENFAVMNGLLQALGIEKGVKFAPDDRMTTILERAAREGRAQMLVSAYASSRPDRIAWPGRRWEWAALTENADFSTPSGTDMEARDRWFAQAQATSPAMFRRTAGAGSLYWLGARDNTGAFLDGGKTYTLNIPQPVPAKLFWSVTVYDADTRSQIQTDQDKSALRSMFELTDTAADETANQLKRPPWPRAAPCVREVKS